MSTVTPDSDDAGAVLFKDVTPAGQHERLAPVGVTPRLARRLQAAVRRRDPLV